MSDEDAWQANARRGREFVARHDRAQIGSLSDHYDGVLKGRTSGDPSPIAAAAAG